MKFCIPPGYRCPENECFYRSQYGVETLHVILDEARWSGTQTCNGGLELGTESRTHSLTALWRRMDPPWLIARDIPSVFEKGPPAGGGGRAAEAYKMESAIPISSSTRVMNFAMWIPSIRA